MKNNNHNERSIGFNSNDQSNDGKDENSVIYRNVSISRLLSELSLEHKCDRVKCIQMSSKVKTMKMIISTIHQLNDYFLNKIVQFKCDENITIKQEKQHLYDLISVNQNIIEQNLLKIIANQNSRKTSLRRTAQTKYIDDQSEHTRVCTNFKTKSSKQSCDFCGKKFWPSAMKNHLNKHWKEALIDKTQIIENNPEKKELSKEAEDNFCDYTECRPKFVNQSKHDSDLNECDLEISQNVVSKLIDNDDKQFDQNDKMNRFEDNSCEEESSPTEQQRKTKVKKSICVKKVSKTNKRFASNSGLVCVECGKSLSSQKLLNRHLSLHSRGNLFKCDSIGCDFETCSEHWLKRHRWQKHGLEVDTKTESGVHKKEPNPRSQTGERKLTCSWPGCQRSFRDRYQVKVHTRIHTGERPYECEWPGCEAKFRNSQCLSMHYIRHDKTLKRRYTCDWPECDKSFDTSKLVQQHIYAAHTKEKPFKCSVEGCEAKFSSKRTLEKHNRNVHVLKVERIKHFECDKSGCNRCFYDEQSLEKHVAKVHEKEKATRVRNKRTRKLQPKYKCDWPGCEHIALFPNSMRIHRMRHTGERPIKCSWPNCQFSTVRKYELDSHMLKHTGETPFPCEFASCGRRFKSQRALDYHSEKTHSNRQ